MNSTIGGGAESMSRVGIGASGGAWPMDPSMAVPAYFMPQGVSADLIATKYGFSRDDVDAYAVQSQQRAAKAWDEGRFNKSVVPVKDINGLTILAKDEHMRPTTTMQSLGQLQPSFVGDGPDGRLRRGGDPVASGNRDASTTCTTPAIPPASSTAPARCCSAARRRARSTA